MALKYYLIVLSIVCLTNCELVSKNDTEEHSNLRKRDVNSYVGLVACAMKQDLPCFIDVAQDYLENRRTDLLAQADAQMLESGRSDPDSKPSHLADTLTKLITEITGMFQNGFSGLFDAGREADEDDSELENDTTEVTTTSDSNGAVSRGHKKKDGIIIKIIRYVKALVYALVLGASVLIVLFMFNTFVNFKLLLVTMWGVAFLGIKAYLAKKHSPEPVIVHDHDEQVHHDHHYVDHSHIGLDDDWHRQYLPKERVHDMAYGGQKPSSGMLSWLD